MNLNDCIRLYKRLSKSYIFECEADQPRRLIWLVDDTDRDFLRTFFLTKFRHALPMAAVRSSLSRAITAAP
jgi:hypothetical protein